MKKLIYAAILAMALSPCAANAASAETPFYQGKTVTLIAATAPGGGTDTFARLLARFLPQHIPGNPTVIVENMPGGSGVVGANYVYVKAKPDGLTLLVATGASLSMEQRQGTNGVLYDVTRMNMVVALDAGIACFVSPKTGIRQPQDIKSPTTELIRGGASRFVDTSVATDLAMREVFKIKPYRPIYGYDSEGPARLAYIRGETNMHCNDTIGYATPVVQQLIQTGEAIPVFQTGIIDPEGKMIRHPAAADVPTVAELYQQMYGTLPTGIAWDVLKSQILSGSFSKIMALPPGTPSERVQELEQAVADLVKDSAWIAESKTATGEALVPPLISIGEQAQGQIRDYMAVKTEVKEWLANWLKAE